MSTWEMFIVKSVYPIPPSQTSFHILILPLGLVYQALELLSTESTMKVQDSQRKCPISQQIALSGFLQVITDIFTEDVDIDEPPPALDLV